MRAAPFRRRLLADLVDLALLAAVVGGLWSARLLGPQDLPPRQHDWIDYGAELLAEHLHLFRPLLVFAVTLGLMYPVAARGLAGRTAGEALLGLRLVALDGEPAGPLRSLAHAAGALAGLALLLLGYAWAAVDPRRQGLAEYLSGSVLIAGKVETR